MTTETKIKKVSEFLKDLDSHTVYKEPELSDEFKKETGFDAPWPKQTLEDTNKSVGEFKGLNKKIEGHRDEKVSYGWQIAEACELKFAKTRTYANYNGRGFAFRAAIKALEDKEL